MEPKARGDCRSWPPLRIAPMLLATCLLMGYMLSGCATKGGPGAEVSGSSEVTGALQGVVVDTGVRPVAGAHVSVTRGAGAVLNATTGADGRFRFGGLVPGEYLVKVDKLRYSSVLTTLHVSAGLGDPPVAKLMIEFQSASLPYANVYKYNGFYECGTNVIRVCANINIATSIVICANSGGRVCLGNITNDRSLFFQYVAPGVNFLQAELAWSATSSTGEALTMLVGGGTEAELKGGVNLPAYNITSGKSPLLARITNHEGPNSWCGRTAACPKPDTLNQSTIGTKRALLVQIDTGPTVPVSPLCGTVSPWCGAGVAFQQQFSLFTIAFYNYEPPKDWLFAKTGEVPPPPV